MKTKGSEYNVHRDCMWRQNLWEKSAHYTWVNTVNYANVWAQIKAKFQFQKQILLWKRWFWSKHFSNSVCQNLHCVAFTLEVWKYTTVKTPIRNIQGVRDEYGYANPPIRIKFYANPPIRVKFFVKSVDQWLFLLKSVYSVVRWITKAKLTAASCIFHMKLEYGKRTK